MRSEVSPLKSRRLPSFASNQQQTRGRAMDKRAQNIIAIFLERAQAYEVPKPFAAGVDHVGEAENETKADTYRIAADVVEKTFKDR